MRTAVACSAPTSDATVEPLRILVVDDDPAIREGLAELLEFEGYEVATAIDGLAALDHLRRGPRPSLIILDLMMPRLSGWDFRTEQLKDDDLKNIPVAVMTAASATETGLRATLGDIAFLRKPMSHDELLSIVQRSCGEPSH